MTSLKKGNGNGLKAADIIAAITEAQGFVTKAADILGCSRNKFDTYLKRYPTVQEVLEYNKEKQHERVVSKLRKKIKSSLSF